MDRLENLKNIIMYLMADEHVSHRIPSSLEERQRMMRALMNVWEPKAISNDFLTMQDAELQMQREDKGVVGLENVAAANYSLFTFHSSLLLWQGDITRLKVDAIVNAANAQALGCWAPLHNCIDNCIHSAAGIQLLQGVCRQDAGTAAGYRRCLHHTRLQPACPSCHPHRWPDYSRWRSYQGAGRTTGSVLPFLP